MSEKIKSWWSEDGKWFCLLVNDGVSQSTVSLGCAAHFPVGEGGEFVWDGTSEKVGT